MHHLWNPDWTYAFPQSKNKDPNVVFDGDYYAYDEYTPNEAAAEGPLAPSEDVNLEGDEYV